MVQDVTADARYLTAFGSTRAEAIFPIRAPGGGVIVGTLDVESDQRNAFTPEDVSFLEACASTLVVLWEDGVSRDTACGPSGDTAHRDAD